VSFGEFLVSMNVAAHGSAEDKLRWAFRMYDVDDDGTVSQSEIVDILKVDVSTHPVYPNSTRQLPAAYLL